MMAACSVIVAGFNTGPMVFAAVKSALSQDVTTQVIVVDHNNPPDIVARLQQMALVEPRLMIFTGGGKLNLAKMYNLGAKHVEGDFLAFMRPDCLLPPHAISECIRGLENVAGAMVVGGAVLNPDGREQKFTADPTSISSDATEVACLPAGFLAVRVSDFRFLGGFGEEFAFSGVTRDLCKRVHTAGRKVIKLQSIRITHIHDFGVDSIGPQNPWWKTKDAVRYNTKHFKGRYFPGDVLLLRVVFILAYVLRLPFEKRFIPKASAHQALAYKRLMILASGLAQLPEDKRFYGKTIFVTGATSDIGLSVMRRLMASGASVLALSRGDAIPFEHNQLRWIKDDLDNPQCSLQGYFADMAVHCAPLSYLPPAMPMLKTAGVTRVIAFSLALVSARLLTKDIGEKEFLESLNNAERSVEGAAKTTDIAWTILRPSMVYGVGLDQGISWIYRWIKKWGFVAIYPPSLGRCHPVHADDLAIAVVQAMDTPGAYGKSYNVSGGEIVSYREMFERLFALAGKPVRMFRWSLLPYLLDMVGRVKRNARINSEVAYRMNEDLLFFHDAAKNDFGYEPRPFLSDGIYDVEGV